LLAIPWARNDVHEKDVLEHEHARR
jgi:hypothetical protein